jgi:uncharacterized cofD-like protein
VTGPTRSRSVVVVGGGHGCSRSLAALRRLDVVRTAVVSVADDGGSSGRLRRDHDVVALGDLRMALLALASEEAGPSLATLARRRFVRGELAGHSLGNLLLLGLLEEHAGDLVAALRTFGTMVGAVGQVLPVTTEPLTLHAETALGPVSGQAAVASARRIRSVRLAPERAPVTEAVPRAVREADLVLLGPGSLYTSILPVLLVPGMADAVRATTARVVLVGNLREQPGETEGMDLADHVEALLHHVPGLRLDVVLAHRRDTHRPGSEAPPPLPIDVERLRGAVGSVVTDDLGDELDGHDPVRLAAAVERLLAGGPTTPDRSAGVDAG